MCHVYQTLCPLYLSYSLNRRLPEPSNSGGAISLPRLDNRLRVARAELGLSQDQLAKLAGVTRQTVSSVENNQYVPSALLAFLFAKHLEKRVDELFTLSGD